MKGSSSATHATRRLGPERTPLKRLLIIPVWAPAAFTLSGGRRRRFIESSRKITACGVVLAGVMRCNQRHSSFFRPADGWGRRGASLETGYVARAVDRLIKLLSVAPEASTVQIVAASGAPYDAPGENTVASVKLASEQRRRRQRARRLRSAKMARSSRGKMPRSGPTAGVDRAGPEPAAAEPHARAAGKWKNERRRRAGADDRRGARPRPRRERVFIEAKCEASRSCNRARPRVRGDEASARATGDHRLRPTRWSWRWKKVQP